MCGITGYSGSRPANTDKLKLLLLYNEQRGKDSCGIYMSNPQSKTDLLSRLKKYIGLCSINVLPVFKFPNNIETFIGHTRQKTMGAVTVENAHPFYSLSTDTFYGIVGCHNGTVQNTAALCKEYDIKSTEWSVDSQIIFLALAKDNPESVLPKLDGTNYALLWSKVVSLEEENTYQDTIYMYRRKDRPLFIGFTTEEDDKVNSEMYISSTKESLEAIDCVSTQEVQEGYLYKVEAGKVISKVAITPKPVNLPVETTNYGARSCGISQDTRRFENTKLDYAVAVDVDFVKSKFLGDNTSTADIVKALLEEADLTSLTNIKGIHSIKDFESFQPTLEEIEENENEELELYAQTLEKPADKTKTEYAKSLEIPASEIEIIDDEEDVTPLNFITGLVTNVKERVSETRRALTKTQSKDLSAEDIEFFIENLSIIETDASEALLSLETLEEAMIENEELH